MMHILFKGKAKDDMCVKDGVWIYGLPHYGQNRIINVIEDITGRICYVDPETIGQCICIRDKNKRWIFNGDILRYREGSVAYVVKWYQLGSCFGLFVGDKMISSLSDLIASEFEVIGNIHDNPELLKEIL